MISSKFKNATVDFIHTGCETINFGSLPPHSYIRLQGVGFINIHGNIGAGSRLDIEGYGDLRVKGQVAEDVKFNIGAVSKVIFAHRPPQSVIDQIKYFERGEVSMPDAAAPQSAIQISEKNGVVRVNNQGEVKLYRGEIAFIRDNQLIIDGYEVRDHDPRLLPFEGKIIKNFSLFKSRPDYSAKSLVLEDAVKEHTHNSPQMRR